MKTTITIQNLKCGGCAHTITTKLNLLTGIDNVSVDVETSTVSFGYASDNDYKEAVKKLASLGYPKEGYNNNVIAKAKSFVSCASGKMNN